MDEMLIRELLVIFMVLIFVFGMGIVIKEILEHE
uniref:Uncharacterized protein n=1 Tax=Candidatus Kentrum sp. FW TaxID=2126338 RepID=A0A450TX31_9GAMM|nr:MAG: hypothetical protein BECKFW1821C_GA0114237_105412 [Candidatus Kentron sp. FW]